MYTPEEKHCIIQALRKAASAHARLWDVLFKAERKHGVEIEYDDELVNFLATECNSAACFQGSDEDVWEIFGEHSKIKPLRRNEHEHKREN